jgi:outer membrane protein assembly factor BamB
MFCHRSAILLGLLLAASAGFAWTADSVWAVNLDAHSMSATGIFDLDHDSVPELLVPGNGHLYCYDTAGALRWNFTPASQYFPAVSSPVAADINNDGATEVVVATPLAVYALTADGDSLWRRTLAGQGAVQNCISSVALGDINDDGLLEIFCYEVYANNLLCLEPLNGDTVWTFHPSGSPQFSVGTPTVADLDLDGRLEILGQCGFNGGGGQLYCVNDSGREMWHYNTTGSGISGWQCASAAVADVNGDDSLEVVSTANYWGAFCLDCHGNEKWRRSISEHAASYAAIGDVDGDDTLEVVVGLGPNMRCFNDRTGLDKWSYAVATGYYIVSSPCLCDFDGDGLLETVFAEVKQNNPSDPNRPMWILDSHGNALWNDTVGTTMADATAGDINHDRRVEFALGPTMRNSTFWLFGADTAAVVPGRIDWPTLQHDIWRTGWYGYRGPHTAVAERGQGPGVRGQGRMQARPNPFRGLVALEVLGSRGGWLEVFDATGRRVRRLESDEGAAVWDGRDETAQTVPAGCYLVRSGQAVCRVLKCD